METKKLQFISALPLFFLLAFSVNNLKAQSEFGIKGGVNYFGLNDKISSSVFDFEMRSGATFGVFYKQHHLLGPVGLQVELLYQQKGGNYYIQHFDYPESGEGVYLGYYGYENPYRGYWIRKPQRYHYFTLPVLLTVSPVKFLDIYAGPEIGYLFANSSAPYTEWKPSRFSAGLAAGAALKIDKNTKLDIRYSRDLTRIADFGDTDIKNYGWAFTVQRTLFRKPKK